MAKETKTVATNAKDFDLQNINYDASTDTLYQLVKQLSNNAWRKEYVAGKDDFMRGHNLSDAIEKLWKTLADRKHPEGMATRAIHLYNLGYLYYGDETQRLFEEAYKAGERYHSAYVFGQAELLNHKGRTPEDAQARALAYMDEAIMAGNNDVLQKITHEFVIVRNKPELVRKYCLMMIRKGMQINEYWAQIAPYEVKDIDENKAMELFAEAVDLYQDVETKMEKKELARTITYDDSDCGYHKKEIVYDIHAHSTYLDHVFEILHKFRAQILRQYADTIALFELFEEHTDDIKRGMTYIRRAHETKAKWIRHAVVKKKYAKNSNARKLIVRSAIAGEEWAQKHIVTPKYVEYPEVYDMILAQAKQNKIWALQALVLPHYQEKLVAILNAH